MKIGNHGTEWVPQECGVQEPILQAGMKIRAWLLVAWTTCMTITAACGLTLLEKVLTCDGVPWPRMTVVVPLALVGIGLLWGYWRQLNWLVALSSFLGGVACCINAVWVSHILRHIGAVPELINWVFIASQFMLHAAIFARKELR